MKKRILLLSLLILLLTFSFLKNSVFAQGNDRVGILPTSNFYFLKEWTRGIKLFFTFNPIKKIELETQILDEKIKEFEVLLEKEPQNEKALEKALNNYQKSKERLAKRLESLKEISQNPNVDKLLDKIVEQEVRNIDVFDNITQTRKKYDGTNVPVIRGSASFGTRIVGSKDSPEKFAQRIKSAIEKLPERELKNFRAIEIIDRLSENLEPEIASQLIKVREEYFEKLSNEIEKIGERAGSEVEPEIISKIKTLPGDPVKHLMILEELEQDVALRGIEKKDIRRGMVTVKPELISSAKEALIEEISSKEDIKQKAQEQIKKAEEAINQLEEFLNRRYSNPLNQYPRQRLRTPTPSESILGESVITESSGKQATSTSPKPAGILIPAPSYRVGYSPETLLTQAKEHLEKAKKAFEEGKYGEAFGLAVSAQSLAENGLRILLNFEFSSTKESLPTSTKPTPAPTPILKKPQSKVPTPVVPPQKQQACPTIAPACPLENCLKAGKELEAKYPGCDYTSVCEKQCQIEECGPMPLYPAKEGCERICKDGRWQDICNQQESIKPIELKSIELQRQIEIQR